MDGVAPVAVGAGTGTGIGAGTGGVEDFDDSVLSLSLGSVDLSVLLASRAWCSAMTFRMSSAVGPAGSAGGGGAMSEALSRSSGFSFIGMV